MLISRTLLAIGLGAFVSAGAAGPSKAAAPISAAVQPQSGVILAADGCGYGWYRGPYGSCHRFGTGPYPGGYFGPYQSYGSSYYYNNWNGCPPGYWRGPWGHCRDTPYHGRLPGGGWQN